MQFLKSKFIDYLKESIFYPFSRDDGTPIKRCIDMFTLFVYADPEFRKEDINNKILNYEKLEEREINPEEIFNCSWEDLEGKYSKYKYYYDDKYILAAKFKERNGDKIIYTLNIRHNPNIIYEEFYQKNEIKPKGFSILFTGIRNREAEVVIYNLLKENMPKYILIDNIFDRKFHTILKEYELKNKWRFDGQIHTGEDYLYELKENINNNEISVNEILNNVNLFDENDRKRIIKNYLKDVNQLELFFEDDELLIYSTHIYNHGDIILFSCHIDHVFKKGELKISMDNNKIKGTLDNSASIAALIYSLFKYKFPPNVLFTFTIGEEYDEFYGADETMALLEDNDYIFPRIGLVVTLDITLYNYDCDISIENLYNEKSNFEEVQIKFKNVEELKNKIIEIFNKYSIKAGYKIDSDPDESFLYKENDLNTVSLCLPCFSKKNDYHDINCETYLDKFKKMAEAIYRITEIIKS